MDNEQLQQQRRPSLLSGEWLTLPSLSIPVEDKVEDDNDNNSNNTIDDKERAGRIMDMERDISDMQAQGDVSSSSLQDYALFLALYEKFLSSDNDVPLQQEMVVEMLEDFGELVLGRRENDPEHMEHLRHAIKNIVS